MKNYKQIKQNLQKLPSLFVWTILLLSCIDFIYMHLNIIGMPLMPDYIKYQLTNQCFVVFDLLVLYLPFLFLQKYKNWSVLVPFTFLSIVVLFNVGYSRYFHTYVPLGLYTATENLDGLSSNIVDAVEMSDLLLLINLILGYSCYFSIYKKVSFGKSRYRVAVSMCILLMIYIVIFGMRCQKERLRLAEHFKEQKDSRSFLKIVYETIKGDQTASPTTAFFRYGLIVNHVMTNIHNKKQPFPKSLLPFVYSEKCQVDSVCSGKNLIFILVESLASFVIDKEYDNVEITPNINRLIREGAVYRDMKSEAMLGESSDGQMIYTTGLLPINGQVTIYNLANDSVVSICHLMKKHCGFKDARMTIPTDDCEWSQKRMCGKYGYDVLFSRENYNGECEDNWLTDEQLFKYASDCDKSAKEPFFSMVLTSSTHSPWHKIYEPADIKFPKSYSSELKCYLTNIHYMDRCLGDYIETLKEKKLYDKSVLIIAADHKPNIPKLHVKRTEDFEAIPIIIVNSSIPDNAFKKEGIGQSSVFPTVLDMYAIESKWRGAGTSMFAPESKGQIERAKRKYDVSKAMIMSDFFNSK